MCTHLGIDSRLKKGSGYIHTYEVSIIHAIMAMVVCSVSIVTCHMHYSHSLFLLEMLPDVYVDVFKLNTREFPIDINFQKMPLQKRAMCSSYCIWIINITMIANVTLTVHPGTIMIILLTVHLKWFPDHDSLL